MAPAADAPPPPPLGGSTPDPVSGAELAAFVAAVEATTVHGAADVLDLTQSAVTKRLQRLERRLGVSLFDRSRNGVTATAAGRVLYPEAKQALAALQRVQAVAVAHRQDASRELSVAASHTIGEFLLPEWLGRFTAAHPGIRAQVQIVNSPGVLAAVHSGAASVGFVEGTDPLDDLVTHVVATDEIVVVVAPEHRWARRAAVRPEELAGQPYVAREAASGTRAVAAAALQAVGVALRPTLETASTQAVKRALASGGFALLSRLAVDAELQAGSLHVLPVRDVPLRRELRAVHRRRTPPTGAARELWRWLAAETSGPSQRA